MATIFFITEVKMSDILIICWRMNLICLLRSILHDTGLFYNCLATIARRVSFV